MKTPSILEMLEAGVHFGHHVSRWHPKMAPYIFMKRHGVHVIDLEKTQQKLVETLAAVKDMAREGKKILFVSTKPQAVVVVKEAAILCGMPYLVERWIGGLLTNFDQIHKLIKKYLSMKEQIATGAFEKYTKREQLEFERELEKLGETMQGLATLDKIPDALFIPAFQREKTAVVEAHKMDVPIIAITDTNADPSKAAHIIPANDDGVNAIKMMVGLVAEAILEGRKEFESRSPSLQEGKIENP